jgi:hypothetical protein
MADKAAFQVIVLVSLIGFLQIPPAEPCVGVDTPARSLDLVSHLAFGALADGSSYSYFYIFCRMLTGSGTNGRTP